MCKRFLLCFGIFLLSVITCALCFVGVDASAAETYTKWSVSETSAFFGTSIPCNYEIGGVTVSGSFEYAGTYGNDWISACNIDSNTVLSTAGTSAYDVLAYRLTNLQYAGSNVGHVSIPVDIYVSGGFRTFWGICSSLESSGSPNPVFSLNSIADYPDNFVSGGSAALPSASSPQYYNASTIRFAYRSNSYYACTMRALTYDQIDGTISQLNFDGSRFFGTGDLWLFIATPYSYGDVSHDSPTTTAPPVTTAPSSGGQTIINNNVDLTETHSILGNIANFIQGIPQAILNGIRNIFVPSEGFMDEQLEEVKDSFVWYEQIQAVGNDLKVVFGQEQFNDAPIVTLHASQMSSRWSGKQYMSEDELVLDFGEFADYRSSIHTVISVLLWAFFLWRLFARLPDIIHGAGIATADTININRELDGRCDDAAQDVVNSSSKYFR